MVAVELGTTPGLQIQLAGLRLTKGPLVVIAGERTLRAKEQSQAVVTHTRVSLDTPSADPVRGIRLLSHAAIDVKPDDEACLPGMPEVDAAFAAEVGQRIVGNTAYARPFAVTSLPGAVVVEIAVSNEVDVGAVVGCPEHGANIGAKFLVGRVGEISETAQVGVVAVEILAPDTASGDSRPIDMTGVGALPKG